MYNVYLTMQYVGMALLIFEIIYILRQRKSRLQMLLSVLVIAIMINVLGYTMEIQSCTKELALQSVRMGYIGKPFIVLSMFLFVMEYSGIKLRRALRNVMIGIAVAIVFLVYTCKYQTLYYSTIDFVETGVFPHLVLGHGILYNLYTILIAVYLLTIIVVCLVRLKQQSDSLIRKQILYLMLITLIGASGLILFLTGITHGYDTTLVAYIISASLFILLLRKYKLFDALTLAKDEAVDHLQNGLIVIDAAKEMVYSNILADHILSYIKNQYPEQESPAEYLQQLSRENSMLFMDSEQKESNHHHTGEKCVYEIATKAIIYEGSNYGQMIILSDISDSYYYTERLQHEVTKKTRELVEIQREIISSFATMVEARDGITGLHVKNTGKFVKILVDCMKDDPRYSDVITEEYAEMVADAAYLHDIGKIAIPDAILQKEGKLTDEEFAKMKSHPEEGARIIVDTLRGLESDEYIQIAKDMALYHHEKFGGTGYPSGLAGEDIPLSARIMAVADVYEALRSKRHYKDPFSQEKAMSIIEESKGGHFDPDIAQVFLDHIDLIEEAIER